MADEDPAKPAWDEMLRADRGHQGHAPPHRDRMGRRDLSATAPPVTLADRLTAGYDLTEEDT